MLNLVSKSLIPTLFFTFQSIYCGVELSYSISHILYFAEKKTCLSLSQNLWAQVIEKTPRVILMDRSGHRSLSLLISAVKEGYENSY